MIFARFFTILGSPVVSFFTHVGEVVLLASETFTSVIAHKIRWRLFLQQIVERIRQLLGFRSALFLRRRLRARWRANETAADVPRRQ